MLNIAIFLLWIHTTKGFDLVLVAMDNGSGPTVGIAVHKFNRAGVVQW
jgi:hypothetical protein